MSHSSPDFSSSRRQAIEATAGVWLSLRDRGMTPAETEAFVHWLQESADHAAVFESLDATWRTFDQLSAIVRPGAPIKRDTLAPRSRRRIARLPLISSGIAAALTLLCVALWQGSRPAHFAETTVGASQKVDLPDGSVALLNTDSAIDVTMTPAARRVSVIRGEVQFVVHKETSRPFLVSAGALEVLDLGTAFNVRRGATDVTVIVTEGRVELNPLAAGPLPLYQSADTPKPTQLAAGEKAVVPALPSLQSSIELVHVSKLSTLEMKHTLAWQERRLEFESTPLSDVVAEFNRYNRIKLIVLDSHLAATPFSGTFRVDGYEALVALLEQNFDVVAVRHHDEVRLNAK